MRGWERWPRGEASLMVAMEPALWRAARRRTYRGYTATVTTKTLGRITSQITRTTSQKLMWSMCEL